MFGHSKYFSYICNMKERIEFQFVDLNPDMVDAWTTEFHDAEDVTIYLDDFFAIPTDCIVSPANSFGFMDGGLDGVITRRLGPQVQANLQEYISKTSMKEILVGDAVRIPTGNKDIPWCISAPTMRVPATILEGTPNVYLAAKAIFRSFLLEKQALELGDDLGVEIRSVTVSGLGTGVGRVAPEICARQMRQAYDDVWLGKYESPKTWWEASQRHQLLYTTEDKIRDLQFRKK
jgi:O-acetyl-ADP-ribose deacetylase (regulator of RNase III)